MEILAKENYYTPGIMFQKIRINLGNLYYNQGEYKKAITEWHKAVDKISKDNKEMRGSILKNIALAYIKLGSYNDAIDNFTESVKFKEDMKTCMNLLLSNLAGNKIDKTKEVFNLMLEVSLNQQKEIDPTEESKNAMDPLREYLIIRKKENNQIIVNVALNLIRYLEKEPLEAFKYIIESLKKNGIVEVFEIVSDDSNVTKICRLSFNGCSDFLKKFKYSYLSII